MKKIFLIFCISLIFNILQAQTFRYESEIPKVAKDNFHNILLPPNLVSKLNFDFGDIRVFDVDGEEIPYLLKTEQPTHYSQLFREYKILEKKHSQNLTDIIFQNPTKSTVSSIHLVIKNSDVFKELKLCGSEDKKQWYIIKDNYFFEANYNNSSTSIIDILHFPPINYEFFKITIKDYFNEPVKVENVGFYDLTVENGKYSETSAPNVSQNDTVEKKKSTVKITFSEPQFIDKIVFEVEGPTRYLREATLSQSVTVKDSWTSDKKFEKERSETRTHSQFLRAFKLTSFSDNSVFLGRVKTKELILSVKNNDDKPLKIKNVRCFQLNVYLTAPLRKDKNYVLRFGNESLNAPVYDLQFFKDSLPSQNEILKPSQLVDLQSDKKPKVEKSNHSILIWLALGVVIILLGLVSFKMLGEMKKQ